MSNNNSIYNSFNGKQFKFNDVVKCFSISLMRGHDVFGRLVQVRKGCGQFGSDVFLLRMPDGSLETYENEALESSHLSISIDPDPVGVEYTIQKKWPECGFLINNPRQPETPGSFVIAQSASEIRVGA